MRRDTGIGGTGVRVELFICRLDYLKIKEKFPSRPPDPPYPEPPTFHSASGRSEAITMVAGEADRTEALDFSLTAESSTRMTSSLIS